jgi:hypothetical protein
MCAAQAIPEDLDALAPGQSVNLCSAIVGKKESGHEHPGVSSEPLLGAKFVPL